MKTESITTKDILKGAAIGGAFMVPVAGIPLALYLARRLYGKAATPEQVKEIEKQLGSKNENYSFKDFFNEMASFSLPSRIKINGKEHSLVDMQFELEPKTLDRNGRVMNQGSKFFAKIPESDRYLVYDGKGYSTTYSPSKIELLSKMGYEAVPDDWYKKARFV